MLLPFVIFAVLIVLVLLITLYLLYPGAQKVTTIPGLDPSTEADGNIPDITKAGSLAEFLMNLHKEYGPVVSFWIKKELVVSVGNAAMFKEVSHLFDRPVSLFKDFEPLIGKQSIQYRNGPEGKELRKLHDRQFTSAKVTKKAAMMQEISEELCTKWSSMSGGQEHIPLSLHMSAVVVKTLCRFAFGDYFKDEKALLAFRKDYDTCFMVMESTLVEGPLKPGSAQEKTFNKSIANLRKTVNDIIKKRQDMEIDPEEKLFIDAILDEYDNEDMVFDDLMTYMIGGSHTTSFYLTWALYFLGTHQDVQEKLHKEISKHYQSGPITLDMVKQMKYLHNFMDETFRFSIIAPTAARFSTHDSILGGHRVPKNTPVITSIAAVMRDEEIWTDPNTFNPDRFNDRSKMPAYGFEPFGFAGKRKCPGYRLTEVESQILLIKVVKRFKVNLVPGQVIDRKYGIVTKPSDEVWITVDKRN